MNPTLREVLQDAYLAWAQGADETRPFEDFGAFAVAHLATYGYGDQS